MTASRMLAQVSVSYGKDITIFALLPDSDLVWLRNGQPRICSMHGFKEPPRFKFNRGVFLPDGAFTGGDIPTLEL